MGEDADLTKDPGLGIWIAVGDLGRLGLVPGLQDHQRALCGRAIEIVEQRAGQNQRVSKGDAVLDVRRTIGGADLAGVRTVEVFHDEMRHGDASWVALRRLLGRH